MSAKLLLAHPYADSDFMSFLCFFYVFMTMHTAPGGNIVSDTRVGREYVQKRPLIETLYTILGSYDGKRTQ